MRRRMRAIATCACTGFAKRGLGIGAVAPSAFSPDNSRRGRELPHRTAARRGHRRGRSSTTTQGFDHYFVTSVADEIAKLDNGTFVGWARTGESLPRLHQHARSAARRRLPLLQHGVRRQELALLHAGSPTNARRVKVNPNWQFEALRVFALLAPAPQGDCPAGSIRSIACTTTARAARPITATRRASRRARRCSAGDGFRRATALGVIMCAPPDYTQPDDPDSSRRADVYRGVLQCHANSNQEDSMKLQTIARRALALPRPVAPRTRWPRTR